MQVWVIYRDMLNLIGSMDLIADLLNNIRIGLNNKLHFVFCRKSNKNIKILQLLEKESIIVGFLIGKHRIKIFINLKINFLKINKISQLSNKVFLQYKKIQPVNQGTGFFIISTNKGFITDAKARLEHRGGELVCQVSWN